MKKMIKIFSVVLCLLFAQVNLFAQNDNENNNENKKKYEFVKKKAVNKSYNVSASDKLDIQNSFGSVEVKTWNRNEIKVDVDIEVSANTDALAEKIIDRITVTDDKNGKVIFFKTNMKEMNNQNGGNKNEKSTMSINYVISMPAGNALTVKNEFGSTSIPDFNGDVDLTSKFGSLTTGNLSSIKNINVEFGKATLANISSAPVTIKFSKAVISKISGAVKLNLEFCSNVRLSLDNSLSSLDLKSSYSTVNLKPMGNLQASYNISTSFGSFKNTSDVKFASDEDDKNDRGPKFDYEYSGKSGSGSVPVKVKSSFGKIIFGEATEEDMKDKNKSKTKTRTS